MLYDICRTLCGPGTLSWEMKHIPGIYNDYVFVSYAIPERTFEQVNIGTIDNILGEQIPRSDCPRKVRTSITVCMCFDVNKAILMMPLIRCGICMYDGTLIAVWW